MLTFTEEILLLLLNDEDGQFAPIPEDNLACALVGAVLMDLAFANRIDTDPRKLTVIDPTPTGNPILDSTLARLAAHQLGLSTRIWIRKLSLEDASNIRAQALDSLVERGILEQRARKFLWAFRTRRYPTLDGRAEREVKLRIGDLLHSDDIPDPRDVALICLVDACDMLGDIFPDGEIEHCRPRIDQLRKMDLIGRELAGAIADVRFTVEPDFSRASQ